MFRVWRLVFWRGGGISGLWSIGYLGLRLGGLRVQCMFRD